MKFVIGVLLLCVSSFSSGAEKQTRYPAPDGNAEVFILSIPFKGDSPDWNESAIYFRDYTAKQITFKDFTSGDSEHGLSFCSGKWTPDSHYFIFTTNSSGGHSPWHFRTFVYDRKTNSVFGFFDYIPPVVSSDISVNSPDLVHLKVMDATLPEPIDGKAMTVKLSEIFQKAEQGAAANP